MVKPDRADLCEHKWVNLSERYSSINADPFDCGDNSTNKFVPVGGACCLCPPFRPVNPNFIRFSINVFPG